mmetsp:Transcript_10593/g.13741  ORF Transcript_10593/g.13741 Transcript_10593/m.13741 type:complete len:296 (-) Transcript_10593:686-1573(-)
MGNSVSVIACIPRKIASKTITFDECSFDNSNIIGKNSEEEDDASFRNHVVIVYQKKSSVNHFLLGSPISDVPSKSKDAVIMSSQSLETFLAAKAVQESLPSFINFEFEVTRCHVDLVSQNWRDIRAGTDAFMNQNTYTSPSDFFCETFYSRMFERMPEVECLFRKGKLKTQGSALVRMISASVNLLLVPKDLLRTLWSLADRHTSYGVHSPNSFGIFGRCLLEVLEICSGSAWSSRIENAWHEVYSMFLLSMVPRIQENRKKSDESITMTISPPSTVRKTEFSLTKVEKITDVIK